MFVDCVMMLYTPMIIMGANGNLYGEFIYEFKNEKMNITEEQRTEIKQALALMNAMLKSGEQHSIKSTEVFNKALATVNKLPIQNVVESDDQKLEELTEHNTNVVSQFMYHCKGEGYDLPDSLFESFFDA